MGQAILISVVVGALYYGVTKTAQETNKHVIKPVKHFVVKLWKHETKKK